MIETIESAFERNDVWKIYSVTVLIPFLLAVFEQIGIVRLGFGAILLFIFTFIPAILLISYVQSVFHTVPRKAINYLKFVNILLMFFFCIIFLIPVQFGESSFDIRYFWLVAGSNLAILYWFLVSDTSDGYQAPRSDRERKNVALHFRDWSVNRYQISLHIILFVAAFLRLFRLGTLSFTVDEIYIGMAIDSVLEHGIPVFPDGTTYSRGLIHTYIGAALALVFGSSEFVTRLPSALAGIGTVLLGYYVGRDFSDSKSLGLLCAASIALFPWSIEFSRWGRFYSLASFLFMLVFYLSYIGFNERDPKYIIAAGFFSILSVANSEVGFISIAVMTCAYLIWTPARYYTQKKEGIVGILGFALIIPAYKLLRNTFVRGDSLYKAPETILQSYNFLFNFFEYSSYFPTEYHSEFPILSFALVLYAIFVYSFTEQRIKRTSYLLVFSYFPLIIISYYHLHKAPRYLFFFTPLFISAGLVGFFITLTTVAPSNIDISHIFNYNITIDQRTIVTLILAIVCVLSFVNIGYALEIPQRQHGDEYPNQFYSPSHEAQADSRSANTYLESRAAEDDLVIASHFQYYYYYTGQQPDYWLRPGGHSFGGEDGIVNYMSHTKIISTEEELKEVVARYEGTQIWFALSLSLGSEVNNERRVKFIKSLSDEYDIRQFDTGKTSGPTVYLIEKNTNQTTTRDSSD